MKHLLPRLLTSTLVMAMGVVCVNTTQAQFFDDFDSYSDGTVLDNINGWTGWNDTPSAAGTVSNAQSLSAPNSDAIAPNIDCVNQLGNPMSGKWDFTADMYIPSGLVNQQYFIMLNHYVTGLAVEGTWTIQLQFDGTTGNLIDDYNAAFVPVPYISDQWVQVRVIIDLDNDTVTQFYDGQMVGDPDQPWSTRNGGTDVAIGAIDLFSNNGSTAYWDNVSLAVFSEAPVTVPGDSLTVMPGIINSGSLADLTDSDNNSLVLFRDSTSTAAVTQFVLTGTSPTTTPSSFEFVLEGRCVSRPNVVQRVEFYDYVAAAYEVVDEQNAVRMPPDLSITVIPGGDLSRFVDPTTMEIRARVRYRADSPRASFSSRTDQAVWMIGG